jgi:hypothetical protein
MISIYTKFTKSAIEGVNVRAAQFSEKKKYSTLKTVLKEKRKFKKGHVEMEYNWHDCCIMTASVIFS